MLLPENRRKEGENETALIILKISLYFMYSMNMQYERIFSKVAALSSPDAYPGIKTKNSKYRLQSYTVK